MLSKITLLVSLILIACTVQACEHHGHDHEHDLHEPTTESNLRHRHLAAFTENGNFKTGPPLFANGKSWGTFKDWAASRDFQDTGSRCQAHKPTDAEKQESDRVFASWQAANPCNSHNANRNPLCAGGSGFRRQLVETISIDVYWHNINGAVTAGEIAASISVLNAAYAPYFSFKLKNDDVVFNDNWFNGDSGSTYDTQMQNALHQGGCESLNIYSRNIGGGILGYAYLANQCSSVGKLDGVVIHHETVPGGTFAPYNEGDTLTHEVGHWLGLYHTFENGCGVTGDYVSDTAPEQSAAFGCPTGRNTCSGGGNDPIYNFMDYTDDACMDSFTAGQYARMLSQAAQYRKLAPPPVSVTPSPTTTAPVTAPPTTASPVTAPPSTAAPGTAPPTTAPVTALPATTPATNSPTMAPVLVTAIPTTATPVTAPPTTTTPATAPPTTTKPATAPPTTTKPATAPPTTTKPATAPPTTTKPATAPPTTTKPATAPPTTRKPITPSPTTAAPVSCVPSGYSTGLQCNASKCCSKKCKNKWTCK